VMRGQLRYLAESAQEGKTTIQVVPYRAGAHARAIGGVRRDAGRGIYLTERSDASPLYPCI
jgi:hypothetical protein